MYTKRKIKQLEKGLQRDVMMFILHQVKNTKGLTNLERLNNWRKVSNEM